MIRLIHKLFPKVRLIDMTKEREERIIREIAQIEDIEDYFQLHKQAGYEMYARTDDKVYKGYAELATTMLNLFEKLKEPEPIIEESNGYDSLI